MSSSVKDNNLKQNGKVFDPTTRLIEIDYITKQVFLAIEKDYQSKFNSSPFRDLEKNPLAEVINGGQCIIWSRDDQYLFIFHDSTAIIVKVLERNHDNERQAQESVNSIMKSFNYNPNAAVKSQ